MNIFDAFVVTIDSFLTGNWLFSAVAVLLCNTFIDMTDCAVNKKGLPAWLYTPVQRVLGKITIPPETFEPVFAKLSD